MNIFDKQFNLLAHANDINFSSNISDDCVMEWPFFTWNSKKDIQIALKKLNGHCPNKQLIFSGINTDFSKITHLYKLIQDHKPSLWCSVWIDINDHKIKSIRFIFDSFEYFKDKNTINIFGFEKILESNTGDSVIQIDNEEALIKNAILKFFMKKYNIPLQDTPIANKRLNAAVENAKNYLETNNKYTMILPFFSANKIGPIQFFATIIKMSDGLYKVI